MNIDTGLAVVIIAVLIFYLRLIGLQRERIKRLATAPQASGKNKKKPANQVGRSQPRYSILSPRKRDRIISGIGAALILVGVLFAVINLIPELQPQVENLWPLIIVGVGVVLFVIGLVTQVPDLAVPACIVAGIGGILYFQNTYDMFQSWTYAWTLIPGFVGVGIILASVTGGGNRYSVRRGLNVILTSLILFAIFGAIFGAFNSTGVYWPLLLVAAGVLILLRPLFNRGTN